MKKKEITSFNKSAVSQVSELIELSEDDLQSVTGGGLKKCNNLQSCGTFSGACPVLTSCDAYS